jgi:hypothetical protein
MKVTSAFIIVLWLLIACLNLLPSPLAAQQEPNIQEPPPVEPQSIYLYVPSEGQDFQQFVAKNTYPYNWAFYGQYQKWSSWAMGISAYNVTDLDHGNNPVYEIVYLDGLPLTGPGQWGQWAKSGTANLTKGTRYMANLSADAEGGCRFRDVHGIITTDPM